MIDLTIQGINISIDERVFGDMDVLEALYDVQEASQADSGEAEFGEITYKLIPFARMFFGEAQWKRIKQELKKTDDEMPHILRCLKFVYEAIEEASKAKRGELKN